MNFLLSLLLALLLGELIYRAAKLGAHQKILRYANSSTRVMRSPVISDHWKERVLLMYSRIIMGQTLRLGMALLLAIALLVVFQWLGGLFGIDLEAFLFSWLGIVYISVVMVVFSIIRKRLG